MIAEIIAILIAVGGVACIIRYFNNAIRKERNRISIKESLDLTQLPIVTFQEGNLKLNFLLDSGSTHSYISESCAKTLLGTPIDIEDFSYHTSTGTDTVSKMIEALLVHRDKEFKVDLLINNSLDTTFEEVKSECGVQLHGILGSDFLKKHKYILDFSELVVYPKK